MSIAETHREQIYVFII